MKTSSKVIIGILVSGVAVATMPQESFASWELDQWGNDQLDIPSYHQKGSKGAGVKIAILDSGISNHSELNIVQRVSFVEGESADDLNGHGTAVAGIIGAKDDNYGVVGVAPNAELYSVKVLDQNGTTPNLLNVAEGVRWAIANDMDIINVSLSATAEQNPDVQKAFEEAEQAGILVVASVGNHGNIPELNGKISYPAKYESVIGVGAVDESQNLWYKSATGEEVDLVAPGVNIKTTHLNNQYANVEGTSYSAPYVTGILALLKEAYPEKSATELRQMLFDNAKDLGSVEHDNLYGYGFVQLPSLPPDEVEENETPTEEPQEEVPVPTGAISYNAETNTVEWDSLTDVNRYRVELYQVNENGEYKQVSYPRTVTTTNYALNSLAEGEEYQIKVVPRIGWIYDKTQSLSIDVTLDGAEQEETEEPLIAVQNVNVVLQDNAAVVTWDLLDEVTGYRVQAYVKAEDGSFVKDGYARSLIDDSYTFSNLEERQEYQFVVIPRFSTYDTSKQGISSIISIPLVEQEESAHEEVTLTASISYNDSSLSVDWSELEEVSYYRIQRYVQTENGDFIKDGYARTVRGQSYSDSQVNVTQTYQYEITPRVNNFYNYDLSVTTESITIE